MNAKVSKLLSEQINTELYSAYLKLGFINRCVSVGLDGFENRYRIQAHEYAMPPYWCLQKNNERVALTPFQSQNERSDLPFLRRSIQFAVQVFKTARHIFLSFQLEASN